MDTKERSTHPAKALFPMVVAPSGISMDVKPKQFEKERSPIFVTVEGMIVVLQPLRSSLLTVLIIALQSSLESYTGLPLSILMWESSKQSAKASSPMLLTDEGIETEVRLAQR